MSLPWVSRSRLEAAEARIRELEGELAGVAWYRDRIDELTEQLTRLARHRAGMTERPLPEREPTEPMPPKMRALIAQFDDEFMRRDLTDRAERMHQRDGIGWDGVFTMLRQEFGIAEDEVVLSG